MQTIYIERDYPFRFTGSYLYLLVQVQERQCQQNASITASSSLTYLGEVIGRIIHIADYFTTE